MIKGFEIKAKGVKHCPFCGSDEITVIDPEVYMKDGLKCVWIRCDECGVQMSGYAKDVGDYDTAYQEAFRKWERRVIV